MNRARLMADAAREGKSLAPIAEALNSKVGPRAQGRNRWTAAMVHKAHVP
jgi:hypothetical protein